MSGLVAFTASSPLSMRNVSYLKHTLATCLYHLLAAAVRFSTNFRRNFSLVYSEEVISEIFESSCIFNSEWLFPVSFRCCNGIWQARTFVAIGKFNILYVLVLGCRKLFGEMHGYAPMSHNSWKPNCQCISC